VCLSLFLSSLFSSPLLSSKQRERESVSERTKKKGGRKDHPRPLLSSIPITEPFL
jgi:hypothetical protein